MQVMTKPTVRDVLPLVNAYFALPGRGNGGSLHVVLCDDNLKDGDVSWCLERAIADGDEEGRFLAEILLAMSRTQRGRLSKLHGYPDEDPALWPQALASFQARP